MKQYILFERTSIALCYVILRYKGGFRYILREELVSVWMDTGHTAAKS